MTYHQILRTSTYLKEMQMEISGENYQLELETKGWDTLGNKSQQQFALCDMENFCEKECPQDRIVTL